jgi:hypothetical protein
MFFENGHASHLEILDLSYARIDLFCMTKLCETLNNNDNCTELTCLYLKNVTLEYEDASVLFDTLTKGLWKLTKLNVTACSLTDRCIPMLVEALQDERCQLTVLLLGENDIGDEGAGMLFEDALTKEHCKLTELDLSECSLTDRCIPSLCKALQDERCKLTKLWLYINQFTGKGKTLLDDVQEYPSCKSRGLKLFYEVTYTVLL